MGVFKYLVLIAATVWASVSSAAAESTQAALVTLEKNTFEAWKSKDAKFWDTVLSDKFIGWRSSGRLDKTSATTEFIGADCEIKNYALSDEQTSPLGPEVALLTYKATVEGTCGGQAIAAVSWAASVYVREGESWKSAFHASAPVVDPSKPVPAGPVENRMRKKSRHEPADRDARTGAMLATERNVWEAWRAHDATKIAALTAGTISFINIFGTRLATKADALENWSGTGCNVRKVSVTRPVGRMLSPTVGILTFKATADGTCYGQRVGPVWGTSIYVKEGDTWKWTFGINLPAHRTGV